MPKQIVTFVQVRKLVMYYECQCCKVTAPMEQPCCKVSDLCGESHYGSLVRVLAKEVEGTPQFKEVKGGLDKLGIKYEMWVVTSWE